MFSGDEAAAGGWRWTGERRRGLAGCFGSGLGAGRGLWRRLCVCKSEEEEEVDAGERENREQERESEVKLEKSDFYPNPFRNIYKFATDTILPVTFSLQPRFKPTACLQIRLNTIYLEIPLVVPKSFRRRK